MFSLPCIPILKGSSEGMDHDSGTPTVFSKEMYQTKFNAETYLGYCYQPAQSPEQSDNWRFVKFVLSHLSRTFSSGTEHRDVFW